GGQSGEEGPLCATAAVEEFDLDEIIGSEPAPEFAVLIAEQFHALLQLLPDQDLRELARLKLEEHTSAEIARHLNCSERTVERKLVLIRSFGETAAEP